MPRFSPASLLLALAITLAGGTLGACSRSDATPAPATHAATSGGEVAPSAGVGLSGLADSVSSSADRGRIRGSESAKVWLVEISDFQCPYCKRWHDDAFAVIDRDYVKTGKVRLAYINFPLGIHPNARAAAEAAMCASVQGRFWELHESLFDAQGTWATLKNPMPVFDSLATAAKVNPVAWRSCMTTHATAPLIDADHDRSARAGVQSTPSFFIGARALIGAYPVDSFRVVLDSAIRANAAR